MLIIIGSQGNIGRRLMAAFPGALGIDRAPGADIVADLASHRLRRARRPRRFRESRRR